MSRELGLHKRSGKNQKRVVIKHNKEIIMHLNSGSDDGEGGRHSPRVLRFESFTFHLFIGFLTASLDGFLWLRRAAVLLSKLKRKATMFDEEKKKSIKNSVLLFADPWQDLEDNGGKGGFKRLTDFKKTHRHLKVLLAIGGWNEGSQNYSELAGHPERRERFVKQSSEFVRLHNFDGELKSLNNF